ncbi:MAG: molybdopterin cofactor-binding domain-containing protein [Novosphingobium sp.]|jgi:isoquinoline 1-oxidoreductase beta subunit
MQVTRRGLLIGAGAAGGLLVAWALTPRRFDVPLVAGEGEHAFNAWLKIGRDGVVTVAVPEIEMGQGITTLIPQIVAVELGADWRQIAVEPAPVSGVYANVPLAAHWRRLWMPAFPDLAKAPDSVLAQRFGEREAFMVAAEGAGLAAYEAGAREAAAAARSMLAMAAAARWDIGWEECAAQNGFIVSGNRRLSFAELVDEAAGFDPPEPPALRPQPASERAVDQPEGVRPNFPRLDLPAKVDGSAVFAGDVRLPGMVFAALRHGPPGDTRLGTYEPKNAAAVKGLIKLVEGPDWLAAVASDWWSAEKALSLISPRFAAQHEPDSGVIERLLDQALHKGAAQTIAEHGDHQDVLRGKFELARIYRIAPALAAPLETATATARVSDDKVELWLASQAPQASRRAVAAALGIDKGQVVIYPVPAGGAFDARLDTPHAIQAALIARDVGKPVQLMWSRWQEQVRSLPRSPAQAVLAARTAADGSLTALKLRVAMPATTQEFGARLFDGADAYQARAAQDGGDPLALAGCLPPYAIEHLVVEHVPVALPLSTGRVRGNGAAMGCFLIETFVDELAARSGREPLSYRMAMLGQDVRLATCLQRAATLAEWGGGRGGSGQGLACHRMTLGDREGRIALVASARRDERGIRVDKLTAVLDIGRVVNLDIARQQVEGGLLFGLALARGSSTAYGDGLPLSGRLSQLALPLLADCPEIEIEFVEGDAPPFDPGELGVAVAAPAIANALFSAGTTRMHSLPLIGELG